MNDKLVDIKVAIPISLIGLSELHDCRVELLRIVCITGVCV